VANEMIAAAIAEGARQNSLENEAGNNTSSEKNPEEGGENNRICEKCLKWRYQTGASALNKILRYYHTFLLVTGLHDGTKRVYRAGPSSITKPNFLVFRGGNH